MTDEAALANVGTPPSTALRESVATPESFAITNMKQLLWAADMAANSGLFGRLTKQQAGVIMWKSARLGIDPLVGLEHIHVINGKPRADGQLLAYLIKRHPSVRPETWKVDGDKTHCMVSIEMRSGVEVSATYLIEQVNAADRKKDNWSAYPEEMLYWRAVRRLATRHFEGQVLGLVDEIDETRVIDVAAVERETGADQNGGVYGQHVGCGGNLYLHANKTGGAYLQCEKCGERSSPPQEVRDAIRGTPEALTVAAQELAPGERAMSDEEAAEYMQQVAPPEPEIKTSDSAPTNEAAKPEVRAEVDQTSSLQPQGTSAPATPPGIEPGPVTIVEPAAEVAVDAAPNAAGFSIADVNAPAADTRSYAVRWLVAGQQRVLAHIQEARTWQGKAKTDVRDALLEAGWIGTPDTLVTFIEGRSPVELAELLDTFKLKVNIAIDNAEEAQ